MSEGPANPASATRVGALTHRYGDTTALDNVTLDIPAGCMAGLIGPDGVGKSTLLGLLAGVRRIQAGEVTVLGGDMRDPAHRSRCHTRIAYMPQGLGKNLYPTLSVKENLDFFGRLFGLCDSAREKRIAELLTATGLAPFPDRAVGALSGGMKQKLGLCCALIHDPDLLILDEPTTGVDPLSRRQFWELIDTIRARRPQMSVLVATAYMEEAERFDWLAAMDEGRVLATGTPGEVRKAAGKDSLEAAFIGLLPEEKRARHKPVHVPPRSGGGDEPAIEATNLTRRFGDFVAVDHVSFRIGRGEIFGFLGSNGCGKTTTMKMLTGLLPVSEGTAKLFGKPLNARDMTTRRRVGYMSQSFSLYEELTVRQNLELHAELFHLPADRRTARVSEMLESFDLKDDEHARPGDLPLGIRQRLQLAVAVIHDPEILILDEPTSGVDPIARDQFWQYLIDLSRKRGVTIFISTHFMNEAERCDRISLMHAGRVLAVGEPHALSAERGETTLEEAFVDYLREAAGLPEFEEDVAPEVDKLPGISDESALEPHRRFFSKRRLWAYARRETTELMRDPVRLSFALLGPLILLVTLGYGISFDVENIPYAAFDQDRSLESRTLLQGFEGSRYFEEMPEIGSADERYRRLKSGDITLAIEIPQGYGHDLLAGDAPEISLLVNGSNPFRAETALAYGEAIVAQYAEGLHAMQSLPRAADAPFSIETRFLFNQAFKSVFAIVPGAYMLLMMLIPSIMTAVGVVREKEMGSIANFRATPVTRLEFLLGKQLPYVALAFASFLTLLLMGLFLFRVPVTGSLTALLLGGALYVFASTAFGLVISSFVKSQIAALFATAIVAMTPTVNFSGMLTPVSSLDGASQYMGKLFPSSWFQQVSSGAVTKGLSFADLWQNHLALLAFCIVLLAVARVALRKQEK
ncbi:ribosome-associated ATPase/putative transporter RbbA [Parvibaculum sp.]|uniref:ribosome-associated ATPase/putative transporter RbbA n=1 Tax=Parvibaculum sp. TaxID=2024848 RepID=UPI001B117A16|nr:ribosome-associated ATPase/putative transporter RbbA [Parvibaculum sp.]MBO6635021.1 ribosome-associated ATPase/putative transporter RbbA [Parvibaculum sp.]MBO6677174.1 ribosome-associated ATPase/putative transporter RbbA [Parvibaculum sp.]MBO6685165.1 ribosome-associated ATPase/putative transporter RbbA [Parvibaculum sp.]MBO6904731.1 ribosome-associated ATPase/putative transporter RbbA [Parvibaculum sp.]